MKKVYLSVVAPMVLWFSVNCSFAQLKIAPGTLNQKDVMLHQKFLPHPHPMVIDTLWPPVFTAPCFFSDPQPLVYYYLSSPHQGYLTGNNQIQGITSSQEVAQRYMFTGNGAVQEVLVFYAYKNGSTGSTSVKIYSMNNTNLNPQNVLGTSAVVSVANVDTTGAFTVYNFSSPVNVNADFFASVVLPTGGDTVAIVSTKIGCGSPDSLAYTLLSGFGWFRYGTLLNTVPPSDTLLDVVILPVVNINTGVNEYVSSGALQLYGAFPVPASDVVTIQYVLTSAQEDVSIDIFNIAGQVFERYNATLASGKHQFQFNVRDLPAGDYYYTIRTDSGGKITSRFSVVK